MNQEAQTPKKSSTMKKFFWAVGIILAVLGVDHLTLHVFSGEAEVTVTDSTVVITATPDTAHADTAKADTAK